jgi:phosphoglycerate dehydrogenase-like enzyme
MPMKLVSTYPWSDALLAEFRAIVPDLEYVCAGETISSGEIVNDEAWAREFPLFLREVADADIVIGSFGGSTEPATAQIEARRRVRDGNGGLFRQMMRASGNRIRWVHCGAAGVEKMMCPEFVAASTILTSGKGEAAGLLLAESIMARLLFCTQRLMPSVEKRTWEGGRVGVSVELRGLTLGIVGFGGTGVALANLALAFGMDVIATKRHAIAPPPGVRAVWGPEGLDDLLRQSDVIALATPSTSETHGMIGLREFELMKRSAVLINVARGDLIQPDALVKALKGKMIAFAALDVLPWPEPWGPEMPLWNVKNALITPHIAGSSSGRGERSSRMLLENFKRFVRGEPLLGVVDKALQY